MSNYDKDDFDPEAAKQRMGIIKITDVEFGTSQIHATYAAEDVLKLLAAGHDPRNIPAIIEGRKR